MKVEHIEIETTDPYQRGLIHGTSLREQVKTASLSYTEAFARLKISPHKLDAIATATISALEQWRPRFVRELAGIATGSGLSLSEIALLNARTEVLAHATSQQECSTVVVTREAKPPLAAQTWDWHPSLAPTGAIMRLATADHRRILTFAEPGTLAKIGMSSAGLGLHFNILHHERDAASFGVPVHAIARAILEEATTIAEAQEIAMSAHIAASTVCTVLTTRDRDARSLELSPRGVRAVAPAPVGEQGVLIHTNHFLDDVLREGGRTDPKSTTLERFRFLAQQSEQLAAATNLSELVAGMCGSVSKPPIWLTPEPGTPVDEQWETLLTIALDLEHGTIHAVAGGPTAFALAKEYQL